MRYLDRITRSPEIMGGKPVIRGLRIEARQVARMAAAGMTTDEILGEYPYLEGEDVMAALVHCTVCALLPESDLGIVDDMRRVAEAREIIGGKLERLAGMTLVAILRGLDLDMRASGPGPEDT